MLVVYVKMNKLVIAKITLSCVLFFSFPSIASNNSGLKSLVQQYNELTCGEDSLSSKYEIVENCFQPYSIKASHYYSVEPGPVNVLSLGRSKYDKFIQSNGIVGIISQGTHSHSIEQIHPDSVLTFTGGVVKFCPNTVEYNLGSRESSSRLVEYKSKLYRAILSEELNHEWYKNLPNECKW